MTSRDTRLARFVLPLVLLLALGVRLWGITFGLPFAYARPDETEVAGPAVTYLSGDLRPLFFQWPSLFGYVVALLYAIYGGMLGSVTGYASLADFANSRYQSIVPFLLISRAVSATMGIATVWLVGRVARRVFDDEVAIVAALFLALSFLHVRDSHFGLSDITMTALVVLAVLAALRFEETGSTGRAAVAGVLIGLAGSTKYNGLGVGVAFAAALVMRIAQAPSTRSAHHVRTALVFSLAAAVGFFGASPYILIDWSRFLSDIQAVQNTLAIGHDGIVIGRGWSYFGRVVLPAAVGWPMWTAAVAGTLWLLATRLRRSAVLLAFPIAYYLVAGRSLSVFARYILPVVPFVCIIAAWCVVEGVRLALRTTRLPHAARAAVVAVAAIITVAPTARQTVLLDRLLAIPDNRLVAAHALADMLRAGEVVYQSGASYGRVPLGLDGRGPALTETGYDEETGRFSPAEPDWVVVQKSPLLTYSRVPASLERQLADRFTLVAQFPTGSDSSTARIYDQQDAFYLPLAGLDGIQRPGPTFDVYKRRAQ